MPEIYFCSDCYDDVVSLLSLPYLLLQLGFGEEEHGTIRKLLYTRPTINISTQSFIEIFALLHTAFDSCKVFLRSSDKNVYLIRPN